MEEPVRSSQPGFAKAEYGKQTNRGHVTRSRSREHRHGTQNPFRRSENAWITADRREQIQIVLTVLVYSAAAVAGVGLLIYSVVE
jgi:hypothetical protein